MLNLLVIDNTLGHHNVLKYFLEILIITLIKGWLINSFPKLCWVKITAALNINRSSNLVGTTVSSWIVLSQLFLVFVFEIGQNGINIFSLPIVHVIGELFLSLL